MALDVEILKHVTDEELEKLEEEAEEFDGFFFRLYLTSIKFYGGEVQ